MEISNLKSGFKTLTGKVHTPEDDPTASYNEGVPSEGYHKEGGVH